MTWIQCTEPRLPGADEAQYRIDEQTFTRRIDLPHTSGAVLLVNGEPRDLTRIDFAMFESFSACEGVRTYTMVFHGEGFSGNLRECRHMWWGEEGYTFYLPLEATAAALTALKEWFD